MSYNLRTRSVKDWKLLLNGESIPRPEKVRCLKTLPATFEAERLIARKFNDENEQYFVKWSGYRIEESTWEPSIHLSEHLKANYLNPPISADRLANAAFQFEDAIQQRLGSRNYRTSLSFDLDIFRFCFKTDKSILLNHHDFEKLPLSPHWYYKINKSGRGVQLSFPIKCQPKLWMKKTYIHKDNRIMIRRVPVEKLIVFSAVDGLAYPN